MQEIDFSIKKTNLYEEVADKLEQMILSDTSQLGQKLPSEQSLATSFGVSRNVIRESLKILKERQLVTLRMGGGSYIAKPKAQNLVDVVNRMIIMDDIDYNNVFEMRMLLEPCACRLAAKRGTDEDFDTLWSINTIMSEQGSNVEERIKYELNFHKKLAEISGNPILSAFVQSMSDLLVPLIRKALVPPSGHISGVTYHYRIVDVLRSRDADAAEQIMRSHLQDSTLKYHLSESTDSTIIDPK